MGAARLVGLALLALVAARAETVFYQFTGVVTQTEFDPGDPFNGGVGFGSTMTGTIAFDRGARDLIEDPAQGSFQMHGAP